MMIANTPILVTAESRMSRCSPEALKPSPIDVRRIAFRIVIVVLFAVICCSVFIWPYYLFGTSIFQINSVGSSTIFFPKINYDHFRALNFAPSMWTALYGAGAPTAVGISSFNPIMLLVSWIAPFGAAMVAYEALLRAIGIFGCYVLIRHNGIAPAAALAAAGLFAFNPYSSSAGSDPQLGLSVFVLPWAALALQTTIERPGLDTAVLLSAALAVFYHTTTIQVFGFTIAILFAPLAIIFMGVYAPPRSDRLSLFGRSLLPAVAILFAAVACIALTAFDLAAQAGNLLIGLTTLNASAATNDYAVMAPIAVLVAVGLYAAACSGSWRWRLSAAIGLMLGYYHIYYLIRLSPVSVITANIGWNSIDNFVFDLQRPRFFFTALGTLLILYCLVGLIRRSYSNKGLLAIGCVGAAFGLATQIATPSIYSGRFVFVPLFASVALVALGADRLLGELTGSAPRWWRTAACAWLVALVVAESANMSVRQVIWTDAIKYTGTTSPTMTFLGRLGRQGRVIDTYENEHTEWTRALPIKRDSLPRWIIPGYAGVQTLSRVGVSFISDNFSAFYDRALHGAYFGVRPGEWSPLLDIAAVTHLISRLPPTGAFAAEFIGSDYIIARNQRAMPRVQLYHAAQVAPNTAALDRLEKVTNVERPFPATIAPEHAADLPDLDPVASGEARITRSSDEEVEIIARVNGRSLVVLADTYHPGWQARVDGVQVPILRANVAFRGVIVEPGEHRIEFRFAPRFHRMLLAIAGFALIFHLSALTNRSARHCSGFGSASRRRRRLRRASLRG